ncbi:uncharacterized protein isoform X1 [Choristoneura fumiferana]|uniref:uncharacterized protein isoform X1 n=1 Tax=Choristoneura fumiferana TaxID=7141 RepID=UPI003D1538F1
MLKNALCIYYVPILIHCLIEKNHSLLEQRITIQALSALTPGDVKDLIPQAGPRVLFTRCWDTWKNEFLPAVLNNVSFSAFDLSNIELDYSGPGPSDPKPKECILVTQKENTPPSQETVLVLETQSGQLEKLLNDSLETSSLLIYKGGSLDGDTTRNLLASVIAKEILNNNRNSPIVGPIYFKWAKQIIELFSGERTTTYYIPACTTATGVVLQARGKLVHQV